MDWCKVGGMTLLADTGPIVALLDRDDVHHSECVSALQRLPPSPLVTTWVCFTEAMYLLRSVGGHAYQAALWDLYGAGRLGLHTPTIAETARMATLMRQYSDTPMDLADASLIAVAESQSIRRVLTFDGDFYIYRLADGSALEILR